MDIVMGVAIVGNEDTALLVTVQLNLIRVDLRHRDNMSFTVQVDGCLVGVHGSSLDFRCDVVRGRALVLRNTEVGDWLVAVAFKTVNIRDVEVLVEVVTGSWSREVLIVILVTLII